MYYAVVNTTTDPAARLGAFGDRAEKKRWTLFHVALQEIILSSDSVKLDQSSGRLTIGDLVGFGKRESMKGDNMNEGEVREAVGAFVRDGFLQAVKDDVYAIGPRAFIELHADALEEAPTCNACGQRGLQLRRCSRDCPAVYHRYCVFENVTTCALDGCNTVIAPEKAARPGDAPAAAGKGRSARKRAASADAGAEGADGGGAAGAPSAGSGDESAGASA